jgi:hypothetical protein
MPGLVIANIAAPLILSTTGNIFIFLSMIPVEMLILGIFFNLALKIEVSFPRLLIVVLVANIATSVIGIPLIYNPLIAPSPVVIFFVVAISLIFSFLMESIIYIPFLKRRYHISILKILVASFWSNLASYTIFLFVLLPVTLNSSWFSTANPARASFELRMSIPAYLRSQQGFYLENDRFGSVKDLESIGFPDIKENKFYRYETHADKRKATITATAKLDNISSYIATVVVLKDKTKTAEPKLISGVCKTNKPSRQPPEMPQLIHDNFQCPPNSSKVSLKRF